MCRKGPPRRRRHDDTQRPRPVTHSPRRDRRRGARRDGQARAACRPPRVRAVLGGRASQHVGPRLDGSGGAHRPDRGAHGSHPRGLGRRDAAPLQRAQGGGGIPAAGDAAPGADRPRDRAGAGKRRPDGSSARAQRRAHGPARVPEPVARPVRLPRGRLSARPRVPRHPGDAAPGGDAGSLAARLERRQRRLRRRAWLALLLRPLHQLAPRRFSALDAYQQALRPLARHPRAARRRSPSPRSSPRRRRRPSASAGAAGAGG